MPAHSGANTFGALNYMHMSAIVILLIASISVAASFLGAFIWSIKHHQFDDDYSPPRRILFDDATVNNKNSSNQS